MRPVYAILRAFKNILGQPEEHQQRRKPDILIVEANFYICAVNSDICQRDFYIVEPKLLICLCKLYIVVANSDICVCKLDIVGCGLDIVAIWMILGLCWQVGDLLYPNFEMPCGTSRRTGEHQRNSVFQLWTHENRTIELFTPQVTGQKLDYIHNNPVRAAIVEKAEDYLYSSARNYAGLRSMVEIDFL